MVQTEREECLVVGCGVSGLTSGIRLLEAGYGVRIWARELPPNTTSNIAAAIWYPYRAYPEALVTRWAATSYHVFAALASVPESGVRMIGGTELFAHPVPDPWWKEAVPGFRHAFAGELPPGYADGYVLQAPVVETPRYLAYLVERFQAAGGQIEQRQLSDLDEPLAACPIVVNCSGLGARELAGDSSMVPIRGQVVRVAPRPGARFLMDEESTHGVTYLVPRSDAYVLGGTAEEGEEDTRPDPAVAAAIIARCTLLDPEVANLPVLSHAVGLRPGRPTVRLETERPRPGALLVHNYGHGGAGITLSWGCAEDVVKLVREGRNPPG